MLPRGYYVNSNTREKTGSKEVEKISQITQIKGWNLRVKFSCRKSPMKKNISHVGSNECVCWEEQGTES